MRIISGKFKGRKFFPPGNLPVRPTTDISKEALFNILNNLVDLEECRVLDLCSGTGNVSYEFISRGASEVVSVDQHYGCVQFQKTCAKNLDITNLKVFKTDLFKGITKVSGVFDIIFCDPPYAFDKIHLIPEAVFKANILQNNGLLIIEHGKDTEFKSYPPSFVRNYGKVNFSFFTLG